MDWLRTHKCPYTYAILLKRLCSHETIQWCVENLELDEALVTQANEEDDFFRARNGRNMTYGMAFPVWWQELGLFLDRVYTPAGLGDPRSDGRQKKQQRRKKSHNKKKK